jgi:hypothetical protein
MTYYAAVFILRPGSGTYDSPFDRQAHPLPVTGSRVPGFSPQEGGFHFGNRFPPGPVLELELGAIRIPVGNASRGLCGGMVVAARDYFEASLPPPPDRQPPGRRDPVFRYLVRRQFASFGIPLGPLRYLLWSWVVPKGDRLGVRGLAWRTIRGHWPRIRAEINAGRPSLLGLIRTRSLHPLALARNHQVLAYAYDVDGGELTVHVYDPNHPEDDTVTIRLSLANPTRPTPIGYVEGEEPVFAFFRTRYRPARPPGSPPVSRRA